MAKLERKNFKVFAENAPLEEMGQFGSAVATTKKNTKDIEEIQELEAWQQGWGGAVISNKNYPPMEEMNGALNVMSYQTAYTLQEGIPEWNKDTVYYIGSIVKTLVDNKVVLYQSLKNDNIGNVLDNSEYWEKLSLGGGGLEVCDIGMALYVDETKGLRRYLNGQIVDINTNTQAFLNRLKDITTLHPSLLCTEEEWQTAKTMSTFGQVGKFVFNYSGDDIVSVRIPRVVNVQGLFDLQNLGMTVEAGLPNIEGVNGKNYWDAAYYSGAFYKGSVGHGLSDPAWGDTNLVSFDASRSNSIYGNSDTVQPEAIQYPYFIQIATGSETENNIINEIELNNPYSLFDSKYSDHELNNLSWLKSVGQWNAKAVYPTAYDKLLKVYNGTETVEGLSVKLSTEEYTDYDFVINTSDETFRLPLLNGEEDVLDMENITTITNILNTSPYTYTTQRDVSVGIYAEGQVGFGLSTISVNGPANLGFLDSENGVTQCYRINVKRNTTIYSCTKRTAVVNIIPFKGNGSLYFYVGETVQNANLIDAGRIGEQLATKTDMLQASGASMPSGRYVALTMGASGSKYTAPADGYYIITVSGNTGSWVQITNSSTKLVTTTNAAGQNGWFSTFMPVKKNDVCQFNYYGTVQSTKFIYAQGASND